MRLPFTPRSVREERSQVPHGGVPSVTQNQENVVIDTSSFRDATILRNSAFRSLANHGSAINDENQSGNTIVLDRQNRDMTVTGGNTVDCYYGSSNMALARPQSKQSHAVFKANSIGPANASSSNCLFDMDSANMPLDSDTLDFKPNASQVHPIGIVEFAEYRTSTPHRNEIQVHVAPMGCRRTVPVAHRSFTSHLDFATNSIKKFPEAVSPFPSHQGFNSQMKSDSFGGHMPIVAGQKIKLSIAELKKRGEIAESSKRRKCPAVGALSSIGRNKQGRRGSKPPHEQVIESQNHQLEWASYQNSKLLDMNSTLQKILLVKDKTIEEMGRQLNAKNFSLTVKDNEKDKAPTDHTISLLETKVEELQVRLVQLELSVDGNNRGHTDTPTKATERQHQTPKTDHRRSKRVTRSASKKL